jgi:hypothetical protein
VTEKLTADDNSLFWFIDQNGEYLEDSEKIKWIKTEGGIRPKIVKNHRWNPRFPNNVIQVIRLELEGNKDRKLLLYKNFKSVFKNNYSNNLKFISFFEYLSIGRDDHYA